MQTESLREVMKNAEKRRERERNFLRGKCEWKTLRYEKEKGKDVPA